MAINAQQILYGLYSFDEAGHLHSVRFEQQFTRDGKELDVVIVTREKDRELVPNGDMRINVNASMELHNKLRGLGWRKNILISAWCVDCNTFPVVFDEGRGVI